VKELLYKSQCYFYQEQNCILNRPICLFCSSYMKKIKNMTDVKDYLSLVSTRRLSTKSLFISIISLIIAIITAMFNIYKFTLGVP